MGKTPERVRTLRRGVISLAAGIGMLSLAPHIVNQSENDKVVAEALPGGVVYNGGNLDSCLSINPLQECLTTTTTEAPTTTTESTTTASTTTTTQPPTTTTALPTITTTVAPQPAQAAQASPENGNMRDMGQFYATCYELRGRTASGTYVHDGTVAVDPNVIPLGSSLHIEGWGNGTAEDTGGAIKGHHIDIWRSSCAGWSNPTFEVYITG